MFLGARGLPFSSRSSSALVKQAEKSVIIIRVMLIVLMLIDNEKLYQWVVCSVKNRALKSRLVAGCR